MHVLHERPLRLGPGSVGAASPPGRKPYPPACKPYGLEAAAICPFSSIQLITTEHLPLSLFIEKILDLSKIAYPKMAHFPLTY